MADLQVYCVFLPWNHMAQLNDLIAVQPLVKRFPSLGLILKNGDNNTFTLKEHPGR